MDPWYRHVICAATPPPHTTPEGMVLATTHGLDEVATADTVVVPAWPYFRDPPGEDLLDALREAHRRGARLLSVCTGAYVLVATGLLDGLRATTHWMHAERFAREFPAVQLDPRVLYVDTGRILTSAGTAAGIDLCPYVVRLDHGAEVANAVARRMVVPPHRDGGQAQFVDQPVPEAGDDQPLYGRAELDARAPGGAAVRGKWPGGPAPAPRTFARQFRAATGTTPHQWLLARRVLLAQRLLEATDEPVERVAQRCGFASAAGLRARFTRAVSASPLSYRNTFRAQ